MARSFLVSSHAGECPRLELAGSQGASSKGVDSVSRTQGSSVPCAPFPLPRCWLLDLEIMKIEMAMIKIAVAIKVMIDAELGFFVGWECET